MARTVDHYSLPVVLAIGYRVRSTRAVGRARPPDDADRPRIGRRLVVYLEPKPRRTDDGIELLPVTEFVAGLASGELFGDG